MKTKYVVGICGGSGSGKTFFLEQLSTHFKKEKVTIISQDDYYKERSEQATDINGITNFDLPTCIQEDLFVSDLKKLIAGETVTKEQYTFNNNQAVASQLVFKPAPLIIVEGLFIFHFKEVNKLLSYKIFVATKKKLRLSRRINRDSVERNYPEDDVLYRFKNHVQPAYKKYIKPFKEKADLVVDNNFDMTKDLNLAVKHIQSHL